MYMSCAVVDLSGSFTSDRVADFFLFHKKKKEYHAAAGAAGRSSR
jgi:hypothetical protein